MKIYDITATIGEDLPVYHEADRFTLTELLEIKKGDFCNLSRFTSTTHTGTHADMPLHFIADGVACHDISLDYFYGPAKVIKVKTGNPICKNNLTPFDIGENDIVLIDSGQSSLMRQPEMKKDYIAFTPDAAQYLVEKKIKTLGFDYLSVDPYGSSDFPVHKILLGHNIVILEGLVLDGVPQGEYTLSAFPLKFSGGNGSPVRAVLIDGL
jgi:arylformamidase